jgi:hypothetical protein
MLAHHWRKSFSSFSLACSWLVPVLVKTGSNWLWTWLCWLSDFLLLSPPCAVHTSLFFDPPTLFIKSCGGRSNSSFSHFRIPTFLFPGIREFELAFTSSLSVSHTPFLLGLHSTHSLIWCGLSHFTSFFYWMLGFAWYDSSARRTPQMFCSLFHSKGEGFQYYIWFVMECYDGVI